MLIDQYLATYDVTEVHEVEVDASPERTYGAIRKTDLRDPIIDALFALRELPNRIMRKLRHEPIPRTPKSLTFADIPGWTLLGEEPGTEFVVGSVGRFWQQDYGWRTVPSEEFCSFNEPGYGKIAISFSVRSAGFGRSVLRYEARTATTDPGAQARFRRYWLLIWPGVAIVMRRALRRIKAKAEQAQPPSAVAAQVEGWSDRSSCSGDRANGGTAPGYAG